MSLMRAALFAAPMALSLASFPAPAQDNPPDAPPSSPAAIQERLAKLEQGQTQLLGELAELRKMLQEKSPTRPRTAAPSRPTVMPLDVHREPFRGEPDARVAIIEYSDFACPYCGEYVRKVYPLIEANYIKPGKVKYFFRDLPEFGHANAMAAALAARCAGEEGKFWEMHDLLFAAQATLGQFDLVTCAQAIGLDAEKFKTCIASSRWAGAIQRSAAGARRMELYGTPAFLIGTLSEDGNVVQATKTVVGGSFDALKSALDEVLTPQSKPLALVKPVLPE
jgi:protein-disulfide isomerase